MKISNENKKFLLSIGGLIGTGLLIYIIYYYSKKAIDKQQLKKDKAYL